MDTVQRKQDKESIPQDFYLALYQKLFAQKESDHKIVPIFGGCHGKSIPVDLYVATYQEYTGDCGEGSKERALKRLMSLRN